MIKYRDAFIWTLPANDQNEIHQKLSNHQKQFTYLPLHILKSATNIGELVLPTVAKGKTKWLDYAIGEICKQMPTRCARWFPELANLRFLEPNQENNASQNKNTKTTNERELEPEPGPSTSTASHSQKRKVNFSKLFERYSST